MARIGGAALLLTALLMVITTGGSAAPGDMVFSRETEGGAFSPAVFPHWIHRVQYRCSVCHPRIFEMEQGANDVTMESIDKGEFCGSCHNGRAAFAVGFETCTWCHKEAEQ
jgi:c(7)-type cytochrome triheme protein